MRPAAVFAVLALLLASACSSAGGLGSAYLRTELSDLLVTSSEVDLPGFTATPPDGEGSSRTPTATVYFTAASGFRQLSVVLSSAPDRAAARATSSTALATAIQSLRSVTRSTGVDIGSRGRRITGRTKGDGSLQDSIYFVEGDVAVTVTLSSSTPDQPADLVTPVARVQDAKLRAAR